MREFCKYGSVRGVLSNGHPYRDRPLDQVSSQAVPTTTANYRD
jgi:hypothetical protein